MGPLISVSTHRPCMGPLQSPPIEPTWVRFSLHPQSLQLSAFRLQFNSGTDTTKWHPCPLSDSAGDLGKDQSEHTCPICKGAYSQWINIASAVTFSLTWHLKIPPSELKVTERWLCNNFMYFAHFQCTFYCFIEWYDWINLDTEQ